MKIFLSVTIFLYVFLRTVQSYLGLYHYIHTSDLSFFDETIKSFMQFFEADKSYRDYVVYHMSWPDIALSFLIRAIPLFLILYFIRNVKIKWIMITVLLYSALTWFGIDEGIFINREAQWSTYTETDVFNYTWMFVKWWFISSLVIYGAMIQVLGNKRKRINKSELK